MKSLTLVLALVFCGVAYLATRQPPGPPAVNETVVPKPALQERPSVEAAPVVRETVGVPSLTQSDRTRTVVLSVSATRGTGRSRGPVEFAECEFGVGSGLSYRGNPPTPSVTLATATCDGNGRTTVELEAVSYTHLTLPTNGCV